MRVTLVASPSPNGEEGPFLGYDLGDPQVPILEVLATTCDVFRVVLGRDCNIHRLADWRMIVHLVPSS